MDNYSLHQPLLDKSAAEATKKCITSGWLSSSGKNVSILEKKFQYLIKVNL